MTAVTCGAARRLAWGSPDRLLTPVERARALVHIGQCGTCQRFVADMQVLRQAVAGCGSSVTAPPALRRSVQAVIRLEPQRRLAARRSYRLGLGLAAALAITALGVRMFISAPGDPLGRLVAQESALLALPGIESSDAEVVHTWLASRLAIPIHVPTFPDARLTGAAIATVGGRHAAVIRFQVGDRHVAYVVAPDGAPLTMPKVDPARHEARYGAVAVVSWQAPGLFHVWMGSLPAPHLASLARRCAEQARAAQISTVVPRRTPIVA